jgi:hypothetical protein
MKVSAAQIRQMKRESLAYGAALASIPFVEWPSHVVEGAPRIDVLRSRAFLVQVFQEDCDVIRLSINRTEWDERASRFREDISWDDLQRLKEEAGYGDRCAVEVLPPDRLVVNVANMRHVFVLPAGKTLPFVWGARRP